MNDRSIRIDEDAYRTLAELAYLLGWTKKAVIDAAVADFERARRPPSNGSGRFEDLAVRERILLRRTDLMRAFEKESASNVRILDPVAEEIDGTVIDEPVVLLAETDLMLGGEAAPRLEDLARRVLGAPVEVISATALSLFNPERLERLVKASTPL